MAPLIASLALVGCTGSVLDSEHPGAAAEPGSAADDRGGSAGAAPGATPGPGSRAATPNAPGGFACTAAAPVRSPAWSRLSHVEYDNTTRDLIRLALADAAEAGRAWDEASPAWVDLPVERREPLPVDTHGSSRRLDQDVTQEHANAWYRGAVAIGQALTTPARIGKLLGACAVDADASNDGRCLTDFVTRFGERVLRRPLAPDDVQFYLGYYGPTPGVDRAGVADVVAGLLTSPHFLYRVVHGAAATSHAGEFEMDAFEVASRLSYHFWSTMPDDELWAAARSGALLRSDEYARQVARLTADARARPGLLEFYRDWLKLDDLRPLDPTVATAQFKAFAGKDLPKTNLRDAAIADALDLLAHFTFDEPARLDTVLTTDQSFTRSAELAALYGVPAWSGSGPGAAFPPGQRPGLLTRAAFLVTGTAITRPVQKGVFIRQNMLCDQIPPPPPDAMNVDTKPLAAKVLSTRQVLEALTEVPGSTCAACHRTIINPLGFATENFDALARLRTSERVLTDDGKDRGVVPVDTTTVPLLIPGDTRVSQGPADLTRMLVESGRPNACAARQYFSSATTRPPTGRRA